MNLADKHNAAAMREALKTVKRYFDGYTVNVPEMRSQVDAALAAPPRNCDRFADETDAQIAFLNEVCFIGVTTLKDDPFDGWTNLMKERYAKWLLAPATKKEGGANG